MPFFIEEQLERAVERAACGENVLLRCGDNELEHNAAPGELLHAEILRHVEKYAAVLFIHGGQRVGDHGLHGAEIGVIANGDRAHRHRCFLRAVLEIPDLGIVDDLMVAAGILERRGAHADVYDLAAEIVEHEDIADVVAPLRR